MLLKILLTIFEVARRLSGLAVAMSWAILLVSLFSPSVAALASSGGCDTIDGSTCFTPGPSDFVVQDQPTCASIGGVWNPTLFVPPSKAPPDGAYLNLTRIGIFAVAPSFGQNVCAIDTTVVVSRGDLLAVGNHVMLFINSSGKIMNHGTFGVDLYAPPQNPPPMILNSGSIYNYNLSTLAVSQYFYNLGPTYLTYEGQCAFCYDTVNIPASGNVLSQEGSTTMIVGGTENDGNWFNDGTIGFLNNCGGVCEGGFDNAGEFMNSGTFIVQGSFGGGQILESSHSFQNNGTINLEGGQLQIDGGSWVNNGVIRATNGFIVGSGTLDNQGYIDACGTKITAGVSGNPVTPTSCAGPIPRVSELAYGAAGVVLFTAMIAGVYHLTKGKARGRKNRRSANQGL